ncbi:metalloregulator ArsR/SmtB family transcription factor [Mycobacterium sp. 852014-52144_SCH5372336]|uniref:ArsR/SmtB family transcription factor n=1 Tax=Mycobacterium sp. 852014-52144_SCH5372336 TaxID=1834115 RepID=UPI0007FC8732|nr:metalloregulator ArsR/SmtB family transcription factor [Mycobacterium sp. 852014-52144_SCH5372336]OBB75612.1 transcriptional regulator [Mycobacterium sp. 852014-52144_SCH5372336]
MGPSVEPVQSTVFGALAEPSRLKIVELLRAGPLSVGEIAEALEIRQPQVSKHLRVLGDSGIVAGQPVARRRIYHLEAAPFEAIGSWAESFAQLWETRLDSLGRYLESIAEGTEDRADDD